ncbi:MAG TPA: helix-turn-helix domain-containing protein [Gammaproteobacteria bacterium]|nr:helix-turn-helix domain-containing protein [Gammaproteobacteria bacterium]
MISARLKQLRLARGWSQDDLVAQIGGLVTKASISKYETGKAVPSSIVLNKLAKSLGVKSVQLWGEPKVDIEFIAYRKSSGLSKREQIKTENLVRQALEDRVYLQTTVYAGQTCDCPVMQFPVRKLEDAEKAASKLRKQWRLGVDPIGNLVSVLEDHCIHVIEIEAHDKFDGISAYAKEDKQVIAAAVVSRKGVPGERQRLNIAHELGHTVLKIAKDVDEEAAAFRFGGAFLAPAELIRREVGEHRTNVRLEELLILKEKFGLSIQAILRRLLDLEAISKNYYQSWSIRINKEGMRKSEPYPLVPEKPEWLDRTVYRGLAERLFTREEAVRYAGKEIENDDSLDLIKRRAFLNLPLEERRKVMRSQAGALSKEYESDFEWRDWEGGDIVDGI